MNFLNKDGLNYLIQKIKSLELKNFSNTTGFAKYDSSTLGNYSFTFTIKSLDLANNKVLLETTDSSIGDWISSKGYRYASIPFDTVFESCKLYIVYNDIEYPIMQSKNNPLYSDYKDSASEVYLGFTDGIFYLNTNVYQLEQNLPTKMSQLENDSNYVSDANYVHTDNNYTTEDMTKLENAHQNIDTLQQKSTDTLEITAEIVVSSLSLPSGDFTNVATKTITKDGYYPLGIVGYNMYGTNHQSCNLIILDLSNRANGSANIRYRVRNLAGVTATLSIQANVLWRKVV